MTDEQAVLAAVAANVDDDTPRLVYADWLDDHGQPSRAEFVRCQVRVARARMGDLGAVPANERQADLLRTHAADWLPPGWPDAPSATPIWHRGFIAKVYRPGGRVTAADARALAAAPTVEELFTLGTAVDDGVLRELRRLPNLRACGLDPTEPLAPAELDAVADWPALRRLSLWYTGVGDAGLARVGRATGVRCLSILAQPGDRGVTDTGLRHLAPLAGLEQLIITADGFAGHGLDALPALRWVSVDGADLTAAAVDALAGCAHVEELDVSGSRAPAVSDDLLDALPRLGRVRSARTIREGTTPRGFRAVGRAAQLEQLSAGGPGFGDADLAALTGLTGLRRLHLWAGAVTPAGLAQLAHFPALRALRVVGSYHPTAVADAVSRLPGLRFLFLDMAGLADADLVPLDGLPGLESLFLSGTEVTDRGVARLGPGSPLRHLSVAGPGVTGEFIWVRRADWAPRLEAAVVNGTRFGLAGCVSYGWAAY